MHKEMLRSNPLIKYRVSLFFFTSSSHGLTSNMVLIMKSIDLILHYLAKSHKINMPNIKINMPIICM